MSDTKPIRYGVNKMFYALKTVSGSTVSYGTPKRMYGARQITITPEGGTEKFYADNCTFFVSTTNNGRSGSVEMAGLSDEFLKDVFGYVEDDNGVIFEDAGAKTNSVALLFECENDGDKPTLFEMLDVTFSRPQEEHNTTEDNTTPDTVTLDYEAAPVELPWESGTKKVVGGHVDYVAASGTQGQYGYNAGTVATYEAWYTSVTLPTKAAA